MRRISISLIHVATIIVGISIAQASTDIFWELRGVAQGDIRGEVLENGHEDQIEVFDFHHLMHRDFSTWPPGAKVHEEIILTVAPARIAASLMQALDTGELMDACVLHFRADPNGTGTPVTVYRIELGNARISSIESVAPDNISMTTQDVWRIRLGYSEITVRHLPSSEEATLFVGKGP